MKSIKLIYVGTLSNKPDRDTSWIHAFERLGLDVIPFSTIHDLSRFRILKKIQKRFHIGCSNKKMQTELVFLARKIKPDWIHFRMPLEFSRDTLMLLRELGVILTCYFNDDPFSPHRVRGLYIKFKRSIDIFHGHFVYRERNIIDYISFGATFVEHCPPAFDPTVRNYQPPNLSSIFSADAAFIGHWEDDMRCDYLDALLDAGFKVTVKGGFWERGINGRPLSRLWPIVSAYGEEYNHIYRSTIAGICFFSKINRDTWTERALEIIAVGGVLVCERTSEAMRYFEDRKEAFFFSSPNELCEIVSSLKKDISFRNRVQLAGYERLISGNHTIDHRVQQLNNFFLNTIKKLSDSGCNK